MVVSVTPAKDKKRKSSSEKTVLPPPPAKENKLKATTTDNFFGNSQPKPVKTTLKRKQVCQFFGNLIYSKGGLNILKLPLHT